MASLRPSRLVALEFRPPTKIFFMCPNTLVAMDLFSRVFAQKISSGIESASRKAHTLNKSAAAGLASSTFLNASEKVTVRMDGLRQVCLGVSIALCARFDREFDTPSGSRAFLQCRPPPGRGPMAGRQPLTIRLLPVRAVQLRQTPTPHLS